jgi:hypothetical protein
LPMHVSKCIDANIVNHYQTHPVCVYTNLDLNTDVKMVLIL